MRRIEPAFPDLLPIQYRLGPVPAPDAGVRLDPVSMRLVWPEHREGRRRGDSSSVRKGVRFLIHARHFAGERDTVASLLEAGCGALVVVDDELEPASVPRGTLPGQVVVVAPWLPELWPGRPLPRLRSWTEAGFPVGVLLGLAPVPDPLAATERGVAAARERGASFVVAAPVCVPPVDRRRLLEEGYGVEGNDALEDLFFHTDLGELSLAMERAASRFATASGLAEGLPGPSTACVSSANLRAAASLLLWARRLDLLDAVDSAGWQLRRAAQALLASGKDVGGLVREDNLRIIPGFEPWVDAFARAVWAGEGHPFDEVKARWLGG